MIRNSKLRISAVGVLAAAILAVADGEPNRVGAQDAIRSGSVVKITPSLDRSTPGKDVIVLRFEVQKGWHIYANPVGDESSVGSETSIKVSTNDAAKIHVDYPPGEDREVAGSKWKIYEGIVEIRATVERDAKSMTPLDVVVRFRAVDDARRLLPDVKRFTLP
jgi:hypothetical protein